MPSRRWQAGNAVLLGAILLLVAASSLGVMALIDYSGWLEETSRALGVSILGWTTFKKLRSDPPADDWFAHVVYAAVAVLVILIGLREAVDPEISRLVGLLGVAAGAVMLFAAHRDLSLWRQMPRPVRDPRKPKGTGPKHLRPRWPNHVRPR